MENVAVQFCWRVVGFQVAVDVDQDRVSGGPYCRVLTFL